MSQKELHLPPPPSGCAQTLVMEARQALGFWSFSGCGAGGSGTARKEKGGPLPVARPRCPGLRARFCRRLLSTIEEVLEARLSLVLQERGGEGCELTVRSLGPGGARQTFEVC